MSFSINSVSAAAPATQASSASSLSQETIKRLKALGLNPADYKSEADAQAAIIQAAKEKHQAHGHTGGTSMKTVEKEANALASAMGISTAQNASVSDVLNAIVAKLEALKATSATKQSEFLGFQSKYESIKSEYLQLISTQNMTGAMAQGAYNKAALGLG